MGTNKVKATTLWESYSEQQRADAAELLEEHWDALEGTVGDARQKAMESLVKDFIGYWGSHQPAVVTLVTQILDTVGSRPLYESAQLLVNLRDFARQTVAN